MELYNTLGLYLNKMSVDNAICGGGSIDLFLGRKTRPHKDLDVSVYWEDRDAIVQYMLDDSWDVYEPIGTGYLHKIVNTNSQKNHIEYMVCKTKQ